MKIRTWTKYDVGYLPTPRCRKLRYREEEEYVDAELKEVDSNLLKKAFKTQDYEIFSYNNSLWRKATEGDIHCVNGESTKTALEALIDAHVTYSTYFGKYKGYGKDALRENKEEVMKRLENDMAGYILVDGELYVRASEPMYNITTFGLGHNHGGTGFFTTYHYNSNLSKRSYFNALEYDAAIDYAIKIAAGRGDTKDVARFEEWKKTRYREIIVYDKTLVTRNPQKEHGDGNKLLNDMEEVISGSESSVEAGLLVMALTGL